jgi:N-acetylglucosamine-6-phosphate deacetylase
VDATLIDPKDGSVHQHVTIVGNMINAYLPNPNTDMQQDLKDGIVFRMTKGASASDEVLTWTNNEATTIINLEGRYVLPGLIDCHIHLSTPPGEEGLSATMNVDPDTSLIRQPYLAHEILKRGFTTVRPTFPS